MRPRILLLAAVCLLVAGATLWPRQKPGAPRVLEGEKAETAAGLYPNDWFGLQRAFPGVTIPQERYRAALEQTRLERALAITPFGLGPSLVWEEVGPSNIGGRVSAIASPPGGNIVYLGAANGGVWKSVNGGADFVPVFDGVGVPSIGALALHPNDPTTVYVGTGEANGAVDNYDGAGLYVSRDGGTSWDLLGLEATARIGRVAVDPQDPSRLYVAAMGRQFSTGPDRGLYRSLDAGKTWDKVLFVNDSTGACDVVINPAHPETVFCATWERVRRPTYRRAFGPGCGIWRSIDRGATWSRLSAGLPAPSDSVGRIGLAIARSRPSTIYAQIVGGANIGYTGRGMYRSDNGGATWTRRDVSGFTGAFGGFGWYFGDVAVDPANPERVWALGVELVRSLDGGQNFNVVSAGAHPDQHALWIDPTNPERQYLGNDGGLLRGTTSEPYNWQFPTSLPITQFYAGAIDPQDPERMAGGTQDNNTLLRSGAGTIWQAILGGDGFFCQFHPTGRDTILAEWQNCCSGTGPRRSATGGLSWSAPTGILGGDRWNWSTPFLMSPADPNVVLLGSQRVYKSTNNGRSYTAVSGDLTGNPPTQLVYGTITALDVSAADPSTYYAGTDNGRVWRSTNAGSVWAEITGSLPRRWVTRVTADPTAPATVYVTHSGFTQDQGGAHVFRSTDRGTTWLDISGNLPDAPVNDVVVDPADPQTLYVGTDTGVWVTRNLGALWVPLAQGLPLQAVFDLMLHPGSRTLVAATHGRSMWRLDLTALPVSAPVAERVSRPTLTAPSPNPSRGAVRLALEVPSATRADVGVYDAAGRHVRTLASGARSAGRSPLIWDGADARGARVGPGVYFIRARVGGAALVRRVVRAE